MKKDRRFPGKLNTARMALSFFMALALFVHAQLEVGAASGIVVSLVNSPGCIPLETAYIVQPTSQIEACTYKGTVTLSFELKQGTAKRYVRGRASLPLTLSVSAPSSGTQGNQFSYSMLSYSAPDGVTVSTRSSVSSGAGNNSRNMYIYLNFDDYDLSSSKYFSVTLEVSVSRWFFLNNFSNAQNAVTVGFKAGTLNDATVSYGSWQDLTPMNRWLYDQATSLNTMLNAIFTKIGAESSAIQLKIGTESTNIRNKIQAQIDNDNSNAAKLRDTLNANSKAEIADADRNAASIISTLNANHKAQTENDDKNADDIMHNYDTTDQDSDNKRFDDSQKELEQVEDSLFGDALTGFSSLDMSQYSFGRFTAMLGALTFVSGFLQSCYVKMGDFGAIVTVGLVVMIATKVIGIYRFSTGGDG